MAGVRDNVFVQLYWGGHLDQSGTPFELRYTIPPKTSVYLHRGSAFFDILDIIRRAMGDSHCILNLTGRLLVNRKGSNLKTHIPFPIVSDESWHYFVEQTSLVGELLHVYVTPIFEEIITGMSFTELLTGIIQSSGGLGEILERSDSTHFAYTSNIIESSTHSSDNNLESDEPNVRSFNLSDFKFVKVQDNLMSVEERKAPRVADADIPYYHAPVTFTTGFYTERDDDDEYMPRYSPTKNILEVGMVFRGYDELKNAVALYHMRERKQFKTKHKKSRTWKAVCVHSSNDLQPCFWSLSAGQMRGPTGDWQIKKFCNIHTCRLDYNHGSWDFNCTNEIIANLITPKVRVDPKYKVKHIQLDVKHNYGIDISYKKALYARQKATENINHNSGHCKNCQEQNHTLWDCPRFNDSD